MLETSGDDLFLPAGPEVELVDQLLSVPDGEGLLAEAFRPPPEGEGGRSPAVPWDCSTRYKTELCSSYSSHASCRYAEHCQFAHGLHELRAPSRHPKYKTELCRNFHTAGFCYYGLRCLFVHAAAEQRPVVRRRRNVPCRNLRSFGVCPFGTRCIFQHDGKPEERRPQTPEPKESDESRTWRSRCHTFSAFGFCLNGTRCLFQHCLPRRTRPQQGSTGSPRVSRLPSAGSSAGSSASSPPCTPSPDATAHNAFTFSSQHLTELLPLALAMQLQRLDGAQQAWDGRAV